MNVLYLTNNAGRASTTTATRGWIENLQARGLHPIVVSPIPGEFQQWVEQRGGQFYQMALPFPSRTRPWAYASTVWRLRRIVKKHRVHLIHSIEENIYPIAGDVGRVCGIPVVVGIHCNIERSFVRWAFGRWRRPDRLFFLTERSQEASEPSVTGLVPQSRWRVLPNGLDLDDFQPNPAAGLRFRHEHSLGDGLLIGAASWLRPRKQLEHLVAAAQAIGDLDFTVVLAGGVAAGEEEYARHFLARSAELLGSRLRFLGYLNDLRGFSNALDLYVNTSKEEAFGLSILEALACGCPVVGYPSVSVGEVVLPLGGEIVCQDDPAELAKALRTWLTDPQRLSSARQNARRCAERFDIRGLSDRLWLEYASLVNDPSGRDRPSPVMQEPKSGSLDVLKTTH